LHGNTFGRSWFETRGKQTTNLASLNLTTLKAFPIPVVPLDEQRRIVARVEEQLSAIDALRAAIERAQRRSQSLRRAVLERAFRGELVPQDPTDEPAEALLARIRAERGAADPAHGGRARRARYKL
jgi:type I restriction enzyme S subunit